LIDIEENNIRKGTAKRMNTEAATKTKRYFGATLATLMALVMAATLLLRIAGPAEAVFPGQNGKIVFASNRATLITNPTGDFEIYTMNPDGSGLKQLTFNKSRDFNPSFWPNGRRIVFDGDRDGKHEIYTMKADGSDQKRLTTNTAYDGDPVYSPDGGKIAFVSDRDGDLEIYTMDVDGTNQKNQSKNDAKDLDPAWSPGGGFIAFASDRFSGNLEIYSMISATGYAGYPAERLTHHNADDLAPNWSPDGSDIAFTSGRSGNAEVYKMDRHGNDPTNLSESASYDQSPAFSPDGKKITFTSYRDGKYQIYKMSESGANQVRISHGGGQDLWSDWGVSPQ